MALLSALVGLAACQSATIEPPETADPAKQQVEASTPEEPGVDYQAEPGLTPTARLRKMIAFLEQGDSARARIELAAFEASAGDQDTMRYWRRQIDGDPQALFEAEGSTYVIRSGESLSSISRKFLGDPMQFFLLARFNEIDNPSEVVAGQKIRIPKPREVPLEPVVAVSDPPSPPAEPSPEPEPATATPLVPEAASEPEAEADEPAPPAAITAESESAPTAEPSADQAPPVQSAPEPSVAARAGDNSVLKTPPEAFDRAAESAEQGEMESAIALLEAGLKRYPGNQKVRQAAVLAYSRHGEALLANGEPEQAAVVLAKAVALDPENEAVTARLQEIRSGIQAEAFYQKGLGLRDNGEIEAAIAAFGKALEIAPDHQDAREQVTALRSALVDEMQRQAIVALREEDFPRALALWQRILEVDPGNGTADRYYNHTLELQARQAPPESADSESVEPESAEPESQ